MSAAAILDRCAAGEISPQIALAQLLLTGEAPDPEALARHAAERPGAPALAEVARLAERFRDRLPALSGLARAGFDPEGEDPVGATAVLFDRLAEEAPEAAVAFYSFGDPDQLDAATAELVAVIRDWAPVSGCAIVDLGCGIGRVALALAEEAASILGIDVSAGMVSEARRRAAGRANLRFEVGNGRDLAGIGDASVDLVLAMDSLPFLQRAGASAVRRMIEEARRVLRPGGDLIVFNWSYQGDAAGDVAEARRMADAVGLDPVRLGATPFAIWDGTGFHLRRPR